MHESIKIESSIALNWAANSVKQNGGDGHQNMMYEIITGFVCNTGGKGFHFRLFNKSGMSPQKSGYNTIV